MRVQGAEAARSGSGVDFSRQWSGQSNFYVHPTGAGFRSGTTCRSIKLCLTHEGQQLRRAGAPSTVKRLSRLRRPIVCKHRIAGPADVQAFFDGGHAATTARDRAAGYTHRLALQQVEVSLTQASARPVQGRQTLAAVPFRENSIRAAAPRGPLFPLRRTKATPPPARAIARVITDGVEPKSCISKTSRSDASKALFKEQRARTHRERRSSNPKAFRRREGRCRMCRPGAISATRRNRKRLVGRTRQARPAAS